MLKEQLDACHGLWLRHQGNHNKLGISSNVKVRSNILTDKQNVNSIQLDTASWYISANLNKNKQNHVALKQQTPVT